MQRDNETGKSKDAASPPEMIPATPTLSLLCPEENINSLKKKRFILVFGETMELELFPLSYRKAYSLLPVQTVKSPQR